MNNFIFKSSKGLIKNSSTNLDNILDIQKQVLLFLKEQRCQRSDLHDIKIMINKLLIDKHLQMQVDEYFTQGEEHGIPDTRDE